jgi:hypothetical protein
MNICPSCIVFREKGNGWTLMMMIVFDNCRSVPERLDGLGTSH